jgi:tetratricopeptide (TPR) repeat protein
MLKLILSSLLFAQMASAQRLTMDQRRKEILAITDQELSEVTRLAKQENFGQPDTMLRVSELNREKAVLWREVENEKFLSIPPEQRRDLNRKEYFQKSAQYFDAANEAAEVVVKRFPKYNGIGEVYYILASNYKELGNNELAQKYFLLSSGKSSSKSPVKLKSNIALADYHFNKHQYREAIPLYESALGKIDERWWTKDAFNLAWCYYRVENYDKAINLMKDIHRKSKNNKYIDLRSSVERDIGIFYVDSGKLNDAVSFYNSLGINYTEQFVKIANSIVTQGRFAQAEALLEQASKFEKNRERKVAIYLTQLELFDKYNKIDNHLEVSNKLMKIHQEKSLQSDDLKRFSFQVNKKAAELQKVTASETYKQVPKIQKLKSSQAISYFELAALLNPSQKSEKVFYQAETSYAAGDYEKALALYIQAFDNAKLKGENKLLSQTLEGMLSSLAQSSLDKKIADQSYAPVYSRYLSIDSKSEKANSIYVKLFNSQMDAGNVGDAEKTVAGFSENFPNDYQTQEGMLAKIMEYYRSKKNYQKVKGFVADINSGKYKVSKKYADALRSLMTKIQIEGVQKSLERGDKDIALKGYHQIYESGESTPKAKINAAYNLSALYYEMGNLNQSYEWGVTAVKDMEAEDVVKFSDSYLAIAAGLFLKQHFEQSADFSYRVLIKLCKQNSSNKAASFKNAVYISLANSEIDKAIEIKEFGKNCLIPDATISEVSLELVKDLLKLKRWELAEAQILELEKNSKNYPLLIKPYEELRKVYVNLGDFNHVKEIEAKQALFFSQTKTQKLEIPVEALDLMAYRMVSPLVEKRQRFDQIILKFPEADFNPALQMKLKILDEMIGQVNEIKKSGSGKGIVEAYKNIILANESLGSELKNFKIEGKPQEFMDSFQLAMSKVYNPLLDNARKQRSEIKKLINENKILSPSNISVLFNEQENFKRYLSSKGAILMERGGKR